MSYSILGQVQVLKHGLLPHNNDYVLAEIRCAKKVNTFTLLTKAAMHEFLSLHIQNLELFGQFCCPKWFCQCEWKAGTNRLTNLKVMQK